MWKYWAKENITPTSYVDSRIFPIDELKIFVLLQLCDNLVIVSLESEATVQYVMYTKQEVHTAPLYTC